MCEFVISIFKILILLLWMMISWIISNSNKIWNHTPYILLFKLSNKSSILLIYRSLSSHSYFSIYVSDYWVLGFAFYFYLFVCVYAYFYLYFGLRFSFEFACYCWKSFWYLLSISKISWFRFGFYRILIYDYDGKGANVGSFVWLGLTKYDDYSGFIELYVFLCCKYDLLNWLGLNDLLYFNSLFSAI